MIPILLVGIVAFVAGGACQVWVSSWYPCPRCNERAPLRTRIYRCKCGEQIAEDASIHVDDDDTDAAV